MFIIVLALRTVLAALLRLFLRPVPYIMAFAVGLLLGAGLYELKSRSRADGTGNEGQTQASQRSGL